MTRSTVRKHDRKGTKGVKSHSRSINNDKSVPHEPETWMGVMYRPELDKIKSNMKKQAKMITGLKK